MNCPHCNVQIADGLRFCSNCGKPLTAAPAAPTPQYSNPVQNQPVGSSNLIYPKNPPLSPLLALVNFLIPGLAQIIYGQVAKGLVIMGVSYFLSIAGIGLLVWLASIPDAYMVGNALQNGKAVGQWQFFPG
jgi:TM2 domain-containing membrane protein YozV